MTAGRSARTALVVVASSAALLPTAAGWAKPSLVSCGQVSGGTAQDPFTLFRFEVRERATACRRARSVAHAWGVATSGDGQNPTSLRITGFLCEFRHNTDDARCVRGRQVVEIRGWYGAG